MVCYDPEWNHDLTVHLLCIAFLSQQMTDRWPSSIYEFFDIRLL